jgi:hypothetical protein
MRKKKMFRKRRKKNRMMQKKKILECPSKTMITSRLHWIFALNSFSVPLNKRILTTLIEVLTLAIETHHSYKVR